MRGWKRMLRTLLSTKGADSSMVTVFIDGFAIEPMQIARLFGLRAVQHMPVGLKAVARITQHYKSAMAAIFRLYPTAKRAILIEEDLDVSPDFFQWVYIDGFYFNWNVYNCIISSTGTLVNWLLFSTRTRHFSAFLPGTITVISTPVLMRRSCTV